MAIKDNLDELVQPVSNSIEEFQNTLTLKTHEHLFKYIKADDWLNKQVASRETLKKSLIAIANKEIGAINQNYEEAFKKALKGTDNAISITAVERLNKIKLDNAQLMMSLTNQVFQAHQRWVMKIGLKPNESMEIGKMEKTNKLYNEICKVINSTDVNDEVKVVYKNGRQMPFKSYMEMNARTTLNQEIGKQQMESASNLGVVFWLCNSFEDCRTTHIQYQGRTYYDERYTSYGFDDETLKKIEDAISSRNMISRQEVENQEPYLGNCPNCRHEFIAIPIEDVVSMSDKQLLKDNNFEVSKASEEKYQNSQKQRLYERKIREYKFKIEQNKMELSKCPKGADNDIAQRRLEHNQDMLSRYYGNIRELVNKNKYLERDYKRESVHILRENLGAR